MPGGRRPRLPAIPYARATPPLREWPALHFGVEVGNDNGVAGPIDCHVNEGRSDKTAWICELPMASHPLVS